jgi:hypothetical protein
MDRRRKTILFVLVGLCVAAAGAYIALAALGPNQTTTAARPSAAEGALGDADLMVRAVDSANPRLNGRVFAVDSGRVKQLAGSDLACERVYYAAEHGICMAIAESGVDYVATLFDSGFQPTQTIRLTGLPSRARVSGDGRYGAMTVFVSGDAYLDSSTAFSTRTYILDMSSGDVIGQLERFTVTKEGQPFDAVDFNFWGITFARDPDRFFATLGTGKHHYLVEGSVEDQSLKVLRDGVECPSLSPDGKQIGYKSRLGDENRWRLRVLDLSTLADHEVAETRSIDDQVEWLDNETLVYSDGRNVYTAPADGSGSAELLVRDATSPIRLVGSLR